MSDKDGALAFCKNVLNIIYPEIKNSTEEELHNYTMALSKCYEEMQKECVSFTVATKQPTRDEWVLLSKVIVTNTKKIDSITSHICATNHHSNVNNTLYRLLSPRLRESLFSCLKRRSSLYGGQIVDDEFLFMQVEKGTGVFQEVEKIKVREPYDIMLESLCIITTHLENKSTSDDTIIMLRDNLEKKTDTFIVTEEIMESVFPAIFPMKATAAVFILVSSVSNDEPSPLRRIIDTPYEYETQLLPLNWIKDSDTVDKK